MRRSDDGTSRVEFDLDTFELTDFGFGDTFVSVPAGRQHYQTTLDMTYNGRTFQVQVELGMHTDTGEVFAVFQSVDPATSLPPDILTGFLPPEDGTGRGMGHIGYMVRPKAGLATGTQIRNVASIVFDINPASVADLVAGGAIGAASLEEFVGKLTKPRSAWLMLPAAITPRIVDQGAALELHHVVIVVLGKSRVQAVGRLGRFPVADIVGKDDEILGRIEPPAGPEQHVGELG